MNSDRPRKYETHVPFRGRLSIHLTIKRNRLAGDADTQFLALANEADLDLAFLGIKEPVKIGGRLD
jgi:hypothetical protein